MTGLSLLLLAVLALLPATNGAPPASSAFPTFSSYAGSPYTVTYDRRSIRLNDQPVTFLSGSIHYPRSTPGMWPALMKQAAADGLNMIQIYVFWNWHQPTEDVLDWSGRGNLTLFLDAIAEAGLFANLRIGPYVCAEWDYGGIPTWLSFKPDIRMRAYNQVWMDAVTQFYKEVIAQTRSYFADHGGPIVLAQVENELGGADQRYVDWNGELAASMDVNVPWIMCNGQSANNTINTCNGNDCAGFIDGNGQNGRVLVDQPAMWTENEGWFEGWSDPTHPEGQHSDRTPEDVAYTVARWFARGGVRTSTHTRAIPRCATYRVWGSRSILRCVSDVPLSRSPVSRVMSAESHELLYVPRRQPLRQDRRWRPHQHVRERRQPARGRHTQRAQAHTPQQPALRHRTGEQ